MKIMSLLKKSKLEIVKFKTGVQVLLKINLEDLFIIREGGAWSAGLMNSGIKYGTGQTPQKALNELIENIKNQRGLFNREL